MSALGKGIATATALLVAVAPAALATTLASLKLDPVTGSAGTDVQVTGTWFATAADGRFSFVSPAEIRWGGTDGPVLAVVEPDQVGTFITRITVPAGVMAGHHVIVAVQAVADHDGLGGPAPGTPARTVFTVGSQSTSVPARPGSSAPDGSMALVLLTALAITGLTTFAVASGLLVRDLSRVQSLRGPLRAAGAAAVAWAVVRQTDATGGGT